MGKQEYAKGIVRLIMAAKALDAATDSLCLLHPVPGVVEHAREQQADLRKALSALGEDE